MLNLAKHYSFGKGGERGISIGIGQRSSAAIKYVGISNGGEKRDSERKSGERRRKRRRRRRRRKGKKTGKVHCVVSPLLGSRLLPVDPVGSFLCDSLFLSSPLGDRE